jgi:hypothetical protein
VGILFFIALDLLSVHVAGTDGPDGTVPVTLPDGEDDEFDTPLTFATHFCTR